MMLVVLDHSILTYTFFGGRVMKNDSHNFFKL